MRIQIISGVCAAFLAISIFFLLVSFTDCLKHGSKMTIARRIWLRMALIFALVGIGLYVLHRYQH